MKAWRKFIYYFIKFLLSFYHHRCFQNKYPPSSYHDMFIMFKNSKVQKLTKEIKSLYFKDKEPHAFCSIFVPKQSLNILLKMLLVETHFNKVTKYFFQRYTGTGLRYRCFPWSFPIRRCSVKKTFLKFESSENALAGVSF